MLSFRALAIACTLAVATASQAQYEQFGQQGGQFGDGWYQKGSIWSEPPAKWVYTPKIVQGNVNGYDFSGVVMQGKQVRRQPVVTEPSYQPPTRFLFQPGTRQFQFQR